VSRLREAGIPEALWGSLPLYLERQNVREEAIDLNKQGKEEAGKQNEGYWSGGEKFGEVSHIDLSQGMG
jgi:hypothetical protein